MASTEGQRVTFACAMLTCSFSPIIEMPTAMTGVWRRMGVHLFEGKLTTSDMDRLDADGAEYRKRVPGKKVELVVIFPSDARMTSSERARMAALIKRWENERVASSTVILAEGLIGSLQRSVLTGLQMIVPAPHPVKIFGAIAPAVTWLSPFVRAVSGADVTAEALLSGVDDLCARFAARARATR
jgi:hypothetical protein